MLARMQRNWNVKCWWECKMVQTLWKINSMEVPQKIKNKTIPWSSNQTSGYLSKRTEIRISKRQHTHVHCIIAKMWKQLNYPSTDECIKKMDTYKHNGILFSLAKEGNPVICKQYGEPWGHYANRNNPAIEEHILHDSTYMSLNCMSNS